MSSVLNAIEIGAFNNAYKTLRNDYIALHKECMFLKGMALLHFASKPESSHFFVKDTYSWRSDPYTNYFYRTCGDGIGLIVPDLPELRCEADKLGISSMVYFGHNTDPVDILSPDEILQRLQRQSIHKSYR